MKSIQNFISESLSQKSVKQLEDVSYNMFKTYNSTWDIQELKDWVDGKEDPSISDYEEFIDDILAYCGENSITMSPGLKHDLNNFKYLDDDDMDEIEIRILRGMSKLVEENK